MAPYWNERALRQGIMRSFSGRSVANSDELWQNLTRSFRPRLRWALSPNALGRKAPTLSPR